MNFITTILVVLDDSKVNLIPILRIHLLFDLPHVPPTAQVLQRLLGAIQDVEGVLPLVHLIVAGDGLGDVLV